MNTTIATRPFKSWWGTDPLHPLDRHFARFIMELAGIEDNALFLAAALVSRATRQGHVCLDLGTVAGRPLEGISPGDNMSKYPELADWRTCLKKAAVVGAPGEYRPLILDERSRLYLFRYWEYERDVAAFIRKDNAGAGKRIDQTKLEQGLGRYFPQDPMGPDHPDWQQVAARTALTRRFCVITGGPGTGKTTTVAKLLAVLREQPDGADWHIALAAPTGKAAARLEEAIRAACDRFECPADIKTAIPIRAATVHRLLGALPHSPYFRHDAQNPLAVDLVIVDEASMVDLALMAKLVRALPPQARLVLLGDKDQLASVEAGAVLGDICHGQPTLALGPDRDTTGDSSKPGEASRSAGLSGSIVELRRSYRFSDDSRIARVSRAIRAGDPDAVLQILQPDDSSELDWTDLPAPKTLAATLAPLILEGFTPYLEASTVKDKFAAFDRFRILCALRHGPYGVVAINALVEQTLRDAGLIRPGQWYSGRPLLITQNDYYLKLFNGDIGLVLSEAFPRSTASPESLTEPGSGALAEARRQPGWAHTNADGHGIGLRSSLAHALPVVFPTDTGEPRAVLPARLPTHETAFAMTVHKSQGSEFDEVLLLLPDHDSPVLTRELLYTAITRARRKVIMWGRKDVLRAAVGRRVLRSSGLPDAVWGVGEFAQP